MKVTWNTYKVNLNFFNNSSIIARHCPKKMRTFYFILTFRYLYFHIYGQRDESKRRKKCNLIHQDFLKLPYFLDRGRSRIQKVFV